MADTLDAIVKLVVRHEKLFNLLALHSADHAKLIEPLLERCGSEGCQQPATVRHTFLGLCYCDRCAARVIVKARRNVGTDCDVDLNLLRGTVMQADLWADLPTAQEIRRVQELLEVMDEQEITVDPSELQ